MLSRQILTKYLPRKIAFRTFSMEAKNESQNNFDLDKTMSEDANLQSLLRSDLILPRKPKILVIDGYNTAGREQLKSSGASVASDLYVRMLNKCAPNGVDTTVIFPCDSPTGTYVNKFPQIFKYDGVAWTGSSLTVFSGEEDVLKMIQMARHFFSVGIPQFGSCFALQLAAFVTGGYVNKSPKGREMGFGRNIALTPTGRAHPMYDGKPSVFDAFVSHEDEVTHLPPCSLNLSGNGHSTIQAASFRSGQGEVRIKYDHTRQMHSKNTTCWN